MTPELELRPPAHAFRWLIPAAIMLGALYTARHLGPFAGEYLVLAAVASIACCALLLRVPRVTLGSLPVWILLGALLLGYFIKLYVLLEIAAAPTMLSYFAVTPDRLTLTAAAATSLEAYRITVVGTCVFCAVFVLLPMPSGANEGSFQKVTAAEAAFPVRLSTLGSIGILVLSTAVAVALGVLVAGVVDEQRSFQVIGILYYARTVVIPLLILLVLQYGLSADVPVWRRNAIILLLVFIASEVLLRTTRGALITWGLALLLTFLMVRGQVGKTAARLFGSMFVLALLLFPVTTQYRAMRRTGSGGFSMFVEAMFRATQDSAFIDVLRAGAASVLTRFIGVDSLLYLTEEWTRPGVDGLRALHAGGSNFAAYFTNYVVGIPFTQGHSEAPGLLGWFLMAGGWWGMTFGLTAYLVFGWWVWRQVWRSDLLVKPVVQVQFLLLWLSFSSDGTLDIGFERYFVMAMLFGGMEMVLRASRRRGESPAAGAAPGALAPAANRLVGWRR